MAGRPAACWELRRHEIKPCKNICCGTNPHLVQRDRPNSMTTSSWNPPQRTKSAPERRPASSAAEEAAIGQQFRGRLLLNLHPKPFLRAGYSCCSGTRKRRRLAKLLLQGKVKQYAGTCPFRRLNGRGIMSRLDQSV
uniref:(northern house mosquito) hypothetical protein n=1 Tax=Culex pipiens TaxID=7175 RepID=A0A8D8FFI0_CULPI